MTDTQTAPDPIPVEGTALERVDAWHAAHMQRSIPAGVIDMPYAEGAEHPSPLFADDVTALAEIARRTAGRLDAAWDLVLGLRQAAVAAQRDPYADPVAQRLSAILTGCASGGFEVTAGTHVETRDSLEAAQKRGEDLYERHKFECDPYELEWVEQADGSWALIGDDGENRFPVGASVRAIGTGASR